MDLNLNGKTAIVCGSTQGIGKAAAIELARLGCNVVLVARDEVKLKAVVAELSSISSATHAFIIADFNEPQDLDDNVQAFCAKQTVHILHFCFNRDTTFLCVGLHDRFESTGKRGTRQNIIDSNAKGR